VSFVASSEKAAGRQNKIGYFMSRACAIRPRERVNFQ
jgi:hypothetical protein